MTDRRKKGKGTRKISRKAALIVERKPPSALRLSLDLLGTIASSSADAMSIVDKDLRYLYVNNAMATSTGLPAGWWIGHTSEEVGVPAEICSLWNKHFRHVMRHGRTGTIEYEYPTPQGRRTLQSVLTPRKTAEGVERIVVITRDITEQKRAEQLLSAQTEVLTRIAAGAELGEVLDLLARKIEQYGEGMLCTILLLEADGRLRHGAAPSLPRSYIDALDGGAIGPTAGSCGTAAYLGRRVIVDDISTNPLWNDYRELAAAHNLRACWSEPILGTAGEVMGTLALYYHEPRAPTVGELGIIKEVARLAAVAIRRGRDESALRAGRERLSLALKASMLGMWELDVQSGNMRIDDQFIRNIGQRPGEFRNEISYATLGELIHPDDLQVTTRAVKEHIDGKVPAYADQRRYRAAGGDWKWVATYGQVTQRGPDGKPTRLSGTNQDIDAIKRAERRTEQLNAHIKLLMDSTDEGICGVDMHGRCTFVNTAAMRLLGYHQEDMLGYGFHELAMHSREDGRPLPPAESPILVALRKDIAVQAREQVFWRHDGTALPVDYSISPITAEGKVTGAVIVFRDTTEARELSRLLARQAVQDPLTGLLNRRGFEQRLSSLLDDAKVTGARHSFCYLDLDQFKLVNDSCGHVAGDQLLKQLEGILLPAIRRDDVLARLGGDEFGVLLPHCPLENATVIAEKLRNAIHDYRFLWHDRKFSVGVSIGVVPIDDDSVDIASVMSAADAACYVAKERGRNRVHTSIPDDEQILRHRGQIQWASRIRDALDAERFKLHFQPIVPLRDRASPVQHFEILTRLMDEQGRIVLPGTFIPAAERYQLMADLDMWILRRVLRFLAESLPDLGRGLKASFAINLSGSSLCNPGLRNEMCSVIREYAVRPDCLCFEITETSAVANLNESISLMKTLKDMGCRFSLDDFGSGMSSFSYLKSLPVDQVKIDGAFIKEILSDPLDRAIVQSINNVVHQMGLETIAEHVETEQILECVRELGVDYAQGFCIARSRPLEEVTEVLVQRPTSAKILDFSRQKH